MDVVPLSVGEGLDSDGRVVVIGESGLVVGLVVVLVTRSQSELITLIT